MSPCQGSAELIEGNGIIADNDLDRFNFAIIEMMNMPWNVIEEKGNYSRELVQKGFSWKSAADGYSRCF